MDIIAIHCKNFAIVAIVNSFLGHPGSPLTPIYLSILEGEEQRVDECGCTTNELRTWRFDPFAKAPPLSGPIFDAFARISLTRGQNAMFCSAKPRGTPALCGYRCIVEMVCTHIPDVRANMAKGTVPIVTLTGSTQKSGGAMPRRFIGFVLRACARQSELTRPL